MTATRTLSQPSARPIVPFIPVSARTAFPVRPQAPRAAASATTLPAAAEATPLHGSTPPARFLPTPAKTGRARWSTRITSGSMLVVAACALIQAATYVGALAGSARGHEVLVACTFGLLAAALEGWRRARSLRVEAVALRSALRAAREAERWHRAVVNDVNDAVLVASPEGRIVEANQAATVLLGQDHEALMGCRLWDLLPLDDRLVALRRGEMVTTHGGGLRRLLRRDGSVVAADVTWSTLDDGRMVYLARRFGPW